jgi:adenylate cyclase
LNFRIRLRIHEFPAAFLVTEPGSAQERVVPIHDRLFIGRECAGIEPDQRIIVLGEDVSRNHCEIRLDTQQDRAYVVDSSTNGTRVNGTRIERAQPVVLRSGDRIVVGPKELEFRSDQFVAESGPDHGVTVRNMSLTRMAMVVGDIIQYSTISEYTESDVLMAGLERVFSQLFRLLSAHRGTLNNYVGDAFFAIWELDHNPNGVHDAMEFALAADRLVLELSPELSLRDPEGSPIRMGWAVAAGLVAVSSMTGMLVAVLGDATNLAFRVSGLAGRDGRSDVLATGAVRDATQDRFRFEDPEDVTVKGRMASERIYAAHALTAGDDARGGGGG